jgi:hypothetical protein
MLNKIKNSIEKVYINLAFILFFFYLGISYNFNLKLYMLSIEKLTNESHVVLKMFQKFWGSGSLDCMTNENET